MKIDGCHFWLLMPGAYGVALDAERWLQVLGKRRKVVADMCEQLAAKAQQVAHSNEWDAFCGDSDDAKEGVPMAVGKFLRESLSSLTEKEAGHYNDNAPLG